MAVKDNALLVYNTLDISGDSNSFDINLSREMLEKTPFGNTIKGNVAGLQMAQFVVAGYLKLSDDGQDEELFTKFSATTGQNALITIAEDTAVGSVSWLMDTLKAKYTPFNKGAGELLMFEFDAETNDGGDIGRGKLLLNGNITATVNGTAVSISTTNLYVGKLNKLLMGLHVTSVTAGSTLDSKVQGATSSDFTLANGFVQIKDFTTGALNLKAIYYDGTKWGACSSGDRFYIATEGAAINFADKGAVLGSSETCNALIKQGSQWIVVGTNGKISDSTDEGETWTVRTSGESTDINGIAYGDSVYVFVGAAGKIRSSTDGITWTSRTSGTTNALNAVYHDGTDFVAVGAGGVILHSVDGITWVVATESETVTTNQLTAVYGDGTTWAAVGVSGIIISSTDKDDWTVRTSPVGSDTYTSITKVGSTWYTGTTTGNFIESTDAATWTLVQLIASGGINALASTATRIIGVGNSGHSINTSGPIDIKSFTQVTTAKTSEIIEQVGELPYSHYRYAATIGSGSPTYTCTMSIGNAQDV